MMHCNGKCYLVKKLREQDKQDQQSPTPKNERFDIVPFFVPKLFLLENGVPDIKGEFFIKDESMVTSFSHAIFHPPSA